MKLVGLLLAVVTLRLVLLLPVVAVPVVLLLAVRSPVPVVEV